MAEMIFNYEGNKITIQYNEDEKIKDMIDRFLIKINTNKENKITNGKLMYLYNGNEINKDLTFKELANEIDKERKIINILVNKIEDEAITEKISKEIICPECKENIFIDIKNYKINLYGCIKNHSKDKI